MSSGSGGGIRYIPRHKRRQQRQQADRLHGAFAGGFSAGYFNTVGSRDGWKPRGQADGEDVANVEQKMEDFMDEQDHQDFGGPRRVRRDLAAGDETDEKPSRTSQKREEQLLDTALTFSTSAIVPPKNVGEQLLRELGWRGGSSKSVFVPLRDPPSHRLSSDQSNNTAKPGGGNESHMDEREGAFLSSRRLRKIQLQQARAPIPPPKLDLVGLGFEAHENAPEFKAYFERLKRERAQAKDRNRQVYKLSNLLPSSNDAADAAGDGFDRNKSRATDDDVDAAYADYEMQQDFIGTKTVGGFALGDEEDDAYDDDHRGVGSGFTRISEKLHINEDEYDTVIQDTEDDQADVNNMKDDGDAKLTRRSNEAGQDSAETFGGALASWASGRGAQDEQIDAMGDTTTNRLALDGRPVLAGFVPSVFGSGGEKWRKHFRGPDVPSTFTISPHIFADNENPMVLQALSRATQLKQDDTHRQNLIEQALQSNIVAVKRKQTVSAPASSSSMAQRPSVPMAGGDVFKALAQSMKDRFTSSAKSETTSNGSEWKSDLGQDSKHDATKVNRAVQTFVPAPLLCKRFGVTGPDPRMTADSEPDTRRREEIFFEDRVLAAVKNSDAKPSGENSSSLGKQKDPPLLENAQAEEAMRPSMDFYRSIFSAPVNRPEDDESDGSDKVEATSQPLGRDVEKVDGSPGMTDAVDRNENISSKEVVKNTRRSDRSPINERLDGLSSESARSEESVASTVEDRRRRKTERKRKSSKRKRGSKDDRRKRRRHERTDEEEYDDDRDRKKHKKVKRSKKHKKSSRLD